MQVTECGRNVADLGTDQHEAEREEGRGILQKNKCIHNGKCKSRITRQNATAENINLQVDWCDLTVAIPGGRCHELVFLHELEHLERRRVLTDPFEALFVQLTSLQQQKYTR
jgi:hypothetical protein